jgi:hypothetical protein
MCSYVSSGSFKRKGPSDLLNKSEKTFVAEQNDTAKHKKTATALDTPKT